MDLSIQDAGLSVAGFIGSVLLYATPWLLLGGLAGLLLAIVLAFMLMKRQLMHRHTPLWNLCAKLGYVVILAGLPLGAATLGGAYGVHRQIEAALHEDARPVVAKYVPPLRAYAVKAVHSTGGAGMLDLEAMIAPLKRQLRYVPASNGTWERFKAYFVNDLLVDPAFSIGANTVRGQVGDKLAALSTRVLSRKPAEAAQAARQLDTELTDLVMRNLAAQVTMAFSPFYVSIVLTMAAVALLLLGEIWIYRRYYRPRPQSGPTSTAV